MGGRDRGAHRRARRLRTSRGHDARRCCESAVRSQPVSRQSQRRVRQHLYAAGDCGSTAISQRVV